MCYEKNTKENEEEESEQKAQLIKVLATQS